MVSIIAHLYKIENKITGEYYFGKHRGVDQRKQRGKYWGSGFRIQKQIKKYGKNNFTYTVLVIGEEKYIYEIESKLVTKELIESDVKCLNLAPGGEGCLAFIAEKYKDCPVTLKKGKKKTEEHKEKIRQARAKQVFSKEHYKMVADKHRGMIWINDGENRKKIKPEFLDEYISKGWKKGKMNSHLTPEFRAAQSLVLKKVWKKVKDFGHTGKLTKV